MLIFQMTLGILPRFSCAPCLGLGSRIYRYQWTGQKVVCFAAQLILEANLDHAPVDAQEIIPSSHRSPSRSSDISAHWIFYLICCDILILTGITNPKRTNICLPSTRRQLFATYFQGFSLSIIGYVVKILLRES